MPKLPVLVMRPLNALASLFFAGSHCKEQVMSITATMVATRQKVTISAATTPVVFVVDDDISVRESLELLVAAAGWRAETYASAHEFLARPHVDVPACLILDVGLPDLNGLE